MRLPGSSEESIADSLGEGEDDKGEELLPFPLLGGEKRGESVRFSPTVRGKEKKKQKNLLWGRGGEHFRLWKEQPNRSTALRHREKKCFHLCSIQKERRGSSPLPTWVEKKTCLI